MPVASDPKPAVIQDHGGKPFLSGFVPGPLRRKGLAIFDAYQWAANYLSVGQIYLLDNPLLREPLSLGCLPLHHRAAAGSGVAGGQGPGSADLAS
jgi:xylulose-5-phosphate/fructose-6-phosphate phosphoketolase